MVSEETLLLFVQKKFEQCLVYRIYYYELSIINKSYAQYLPISAHAMDGSASPTSPSLISRLSPENLCQFLGILLLLVNMGSDHLLAINPKLRLRQLQKSTSSVMPPYTSKMKT